MEDLLAKAYDPGYFRTIGHQVVDYLADYLHAVQNEHQGKVTQWELPSESYDFWQKDWAAKDQAPLMDFFQNLTASSIHLHHPKYVGHQVCPPVPLAALGGLMSDFLNNGMGIYEMGQGSTALERLVLIESAKAMGLPSGTEGILTSGGSLANLTAMLAARSNRATGKVWAEGTSKPLALMVSEEAHYCVDRAARIMGWGSDGIIKVPTDAKFRMRTELLEAYFQKAKKEGIEVIAVVGSACSTSTGSFDDLKAIGAFCKKHKLWFHVDGAHGAPLAFSKKYRYLVEGLELADSITMDYHKMLMIPAVTTALFFKDSRSSYRTFSQDAHYLWNKNEEEEWFNIAKRSFECTKLMMSVKVYSVIRTYGFELFEKYVNKVVENGQLFARLIESHPRMELAIQPSCNIVCFRYVPDKEDDLNALNRKIRQSMLEDGTFFLVQTNLKGNTWLRCTLANAFTSEKDLKELLERVGNVKL